jgi:hypothetical protein
LKFWLMLKCVREKHCCFVCCITNLSYTATINHGHHNEYT